MTEDSSSWTLGQHALEYAKLKWKLIPSHGINSRNVCTCGRAHDEISHIAKHPAIDAWNEYSSSDPDDIEKWWHKDQDYNPAVHCMKSGFIVIDIDPRGDGDKSFERLIADKNIVIPETAESITGEYTVRGKKVRGRHIYLNCDRGETLHGNLNALGYPGIDIKFRGYVMLPPSRHFSGVTYEWAEGKDPFSTPLADAPEELLDIIRKPKQKSVEYGMTAAINTELLKDPKYEIDLAEAFKTNLVEGERNQTLYVMAVKITNHMSQFGQREIDEFIERAVLREMVVYNQSQVKPPLELGELEYLVTRAINWVRDNPRGSYMSQAVVEWAQRQQSLILDEAKVTEVLGDTSAEESSSSKNMRMQITDSVKSGKSIVEAVSGGNIDVPSDNDAVSIEDGGTPGRRSFSDIGNGRRLVDLFGPGIAYTPGLGFKTWNQGYWQEDEEGLAVVELAKKLPPIILSEGSERGEEDRAKAWARSSQSSARIRSSIEIAKSDPRIMVPLEDWDRDPYLFGVGNGVVNLKDGSLIKGAPELRLSMRSKIPYLQGLPNQQWLNFLQETFGGDQQYIDFMQRCIGYTMTGLSNLDRIFLGYGPPGTGKNTFLEPIFSVMGQYASTLDTSIVTPSAGVSSSSDMYHIANLHGKRLAWVDELPEGERFKENTMKKLSGSGVLTGRHPGGRPFTFPMIAKVWLTSNHRPPIYDDAMWRRLYALPFVHTPKVLDLQLKQYLSDPEGGAPGVLSWCVEGAMIVANSKNKDFLGTCDAVEESTAIYRKNEDKITLFVEEELVDAPGQTTSINTIYNRYAAWAEARGEKPMSLSPLVRKFMDKGIAVGGSGTRAYLIDRSLAGYKEMKTAVENRYESEKLFTSQGDAPNQIIIGG